MLGQVMLVQDMALRSRGGLYGRIRVKVLCFWYHADVVVHEPPAVDFTAVGLQNVLSQGDGQVIIKQPNVPKKICQTDCMTEVIVHFQKIN